MSRSADASPPHVARRFAAAFLLGLLPGCSTLPACADILWAWGVTVVDSAGTPVSDAVVTSVLARTGDTLSSVSGPSPEGWYVILRDTDADRFHGPEKFRPADQIVGVTAEAVPGRRAAARFVFLLGECGLTKVSGPDTLTLR